MARITIVLNASEKDALILLSDQERRKIQDMAGFLVREGLELRGMIEPFPIIERTESKTQKEAANHPIPTQTNIDSTL